MAALSLCVGFGGAKMNSIINVNDIVVFSSMGADLWDEYFGHKSRNSIGIVIEKVSDGDSRSPSYQTFFPETGKIVELYGEEIVKIA